MPWPVLLVEVQGSRQTKWWRCISKNLRKPGSWWTTSYKRIVSLLVSPTANEAAGYLLVPLILCMRQSNKMMLTSLPNSFYLEQIQTVRTSGGILPTTMLGKPVMTSRWFLKSMPVAPRFPKKTSLHRWQHCPPPRGFEDFFANLERDPLVQVQSCEKEWLLILGRRRLRNDWTTYNITMSITCKNKSIAIPCLELFQSYVMILCFLFLTIISAQYLYISMNLNDFIWILFALQLRPSTSAPGECTAQVFRWLKPSKIGYVNGEGWC